MAINSSAAIDETQLRAELYRATLESDERADARGRSLPAVTVTLAATGVCALARWWVGTSSPQVLGNLTTPRTWLLLSVASAAFVFATLAYHRLGAHHVAYRWAATLDRLCRTGVLMTSMVLSGQAALFFMLVGLPRGFAWRAQSDSERRRTIAVELLGHLVVAGACVCLGHAVSGAVVVLSLGAFFVAYGMTARSATRSMRARVERDLLDRMLLGLEVTNLRGRAARELHDGVGADVMALVLQLRDASACNPAASGLGQRAERVMATLRSVVWWLRKEEGTLGELNKLVDATCSRLCGRLTFESQPPVGDATQRIGSAVALGILRAAQEFVWMAGEGQVATRVTVSLTLTTAALELNVETDGFEPAEGQLSRVPCAIEALGGTVEFLRNDLRVGVNMRARAGPT